ncbi:MAG: hypothetical protein JWP60_4113 [Ramlibacter sp.]|nr:hypothetical protein [Ramlibacter sp.]
MSGNKTTPRGRDAKSGQFIPVREAQRRPSTTVVERVAVRSPAPKRKAGR